jgi:hypothetical protein
MLKSKTIAVLGLGYVGLPLVIAFGKKITTIGFDISSHKVDTCIKGKDPSKELSAEQMQSAKFASYTKDPEKIAIADFILVAVSTPVYKTKIPDLSHLVEASIIVGKNMKKGAIIAVLAVILIIMIIGLLIYNKQSQIGKANKLEYSFLLCLSECPLEYSNSSGRLMFNLSCNLQCNNLLGDSPRIDEKYPGETLLRDSELTQLCFKEVEQEKIKPCLNKNLPYFKEKLGIK